MAPASWAGAIHSTERLPGQNPNPIPRIEVFTMVKPSLQRFFDTARCFDAESVRQLSKPDD